MIPEQRSRAMAAVGSRDTKYEVLVRSALHRQGFRFRKNDRRYPGTPDIVLPKYQAAIQIHGCFWHGHGGCKRAALPKTRTAFWAAKIARNRERDGEKEAALLKAGFRVLTVWECELMADFSQTVTGLIGSINS
ncbi:very short patch repair endonuclease [Candidatus Neomarinimicrobiota bacterium]